MKNNMPFMKLIFSVGLISVAIVCAVIFRLYIVKLEEQTHHYHGMLRDQAELLEYLYLNGSDEIKANLQAFVSDENILAQNRDPNLMVRLDEKLALDAHGATGRIVGGKIIGNEIVYFRVGNNPNDFIPNPTSLEFEGFSPMVEAVKGRSGTAQFPGVENQGLVATYQPVPALGIGIVSLIEVSEIRAPFIKYGFITLFVGALGMLAGFLIYKRQGIPFVEQLGRDINKHKSRAKETEALLEESEKKYQSIFENSEDPMWLMANGNFIKCNDAAVKTFNCQSREDFENTHPSHFSPLQQPDGSNSYLKAEEMMKKAMEEGYARFHWTHKRIDNNEEFPAEVTLTRITMDGMPGLHALVRDITEAKIIEENLQKALVDAERANVAKTEFLASMSHEFRTPLNAILGFSEMLRAQYLGPMGVEKYSEYVGDIHSSGEHLLDLINDILDISAIEARQSPMDKTFFDLGALVDECIVNTEPQAEEKEISVNKNLIGALDHIYAHRRGIKQILINLIANGIKYNHSGGSVTVKCYKEHETLHISVSDNGFGIEEEFLPRVMEPFSRVEEDAHMAQEGTGLGLSICQKLIEAYEGKIHIESTHGIGTTVMIEIPISDEPEMRQAG